MGRVIHLDGVGNERKRLSQAVILAIRALMLQSEPNDETRDLAAFIAIALESIHQTIDISVSAWEKRGYWIKADRFRLDWAWCERLGLVMRTAALKQDWPIVASTAAEIAQRLSTVKVPQRHRLGTPWVGAWDILNKKITRLN